MKRQTKILLIITGSIAAYKVPDIISALKNKEYDVQCVMTDSSKEFITELTISSVSGNKVYSELFSLDDESNMGHIRLAKENDLILIAPATANFIAKLAGGFADDLASTLVLASDKKILVAPAMNCQMWENKITQRNLAKLVDLGVEIIDPDEGKLACGEFGYGKLASLDKIIGSVENLLK